MPIISTFFGIIIRMYFGDHNPPHFMSSFREKRPRLILTVNFLLEIFPQGQPGNSCVTGLVVTGSNS